MIDISFIHFDQNSISLYGRRVAFCGTKPDMPINFLPDDMVSITDDEKRAVVAAVLKHHKGRVKVSKATARYFPEDLSIYERDEREVADT